MNELTPPERFAAIVTAQAAGLAVLFLIANAAVPVGRPDLAPGIRWIGYATVTLIIVSLAGVFLTFGLSKRQSGNGSFTDSAVNWTVILYLLCDIFLLLFMVCQQGGLCRSMFVPIFFLIPIALKIVDKRTWL